MKNKTKHPLSITVAGLMSAYLIFTGVFVGGGIPALITATMGIGIGAAFVALITKRSEGKIYNAAMLLGGLPSLGFVCIPIWTMFQGAFKPEGLISLVIGIIGVLIISKVASTDEEVEGALEESAVEVNE
jgi:FtsH-binding integral membrane protein